MDKHCAILGGFAIFSAAAGIHSLTNGHKVMGAILIAMGALDAAGVWAHRELVAQGRA